MIAPYPQFDTARNFPAAAEQYEVVLGCAKAARSLTAEYGILDGGAVFIQPSTSAAYFITQEQKISIQALSGKTVGQVTILALEDAHPGNCAIFVVSSSITVLLDVSGKIHDVNAEITKLQQKVKKAEDVVLKQESPIASPGFEGNVSEVVRLTERKRLDDARRAIQNYERTIAQFRNMKIER